MSFRRAQINSSFERITPVTPTASLKALACCRAFWPVVASSTSQTACGRAWQSLADYTIDLLQLLHQIEARMQATCRIYHDDVHAARDSGLDCIERNRARIGFRSARDYIHPQPVPQT